MFDYFVVGGGAAKVTVLLTKFFTKYPRKAVPDVIPMVAQLSTSGVVLNA